jgi:hypothetical protein
VTGKKAATYAGFTAKELRDEKIYKEKLAKFITCLKKPLPPAVEHIGPPKH